MFQSPFAYVDFDSAHGGACPISARPAAPKPFVAGTPLAAPEPVVYTEPARPVVFDFRTFRETPIEALERHYWSQGTPALPGRPLPPKREQYDPAEMSLDHLIATQRTGSNLPSIARAAWLAGAEVDTLDLPATADGTDSLAETIPADSTYYDHLQTIIPREAMTAEQTAAYEAFSAEFAGRHGVQYLIPDPATRQKIEWEQHARRCSVTAKYGVRLAEDGSHTTFYALAGRRLSRDEFLAAKQRWVADFLARTGLDKVPSAAEFAAKRAQYAQLRNVNAFDDIAAANAATYEAEHDLLVHEEPLDEDFAHSYEAVDDPYIPSLALFQYQVDREADRGSCRLNPRWPAAKNARVHATTLRVEAQRRHRAAVEAALGPDDDPVEPTRILRFRSLRDHLRHLRGNHDALWHGTIPEDDVDPSAVSLG